MQSLGLTRSLPVLGRRKVGNAFLQNGASVGVTVPPTTVTTPRRGVSSDEIKGKTVKLGYWGSQGIHPGYPRTTPERLPGVDLNLQERLDELYSEENERRKNRKDIGFPPKKIGEIFFYSIKNGKHNTLQH